MAPTRPRGAGRARRDAPTPGTTSRSSGATATPRLRRRCSARARGAGARVRRPGAGVVARDDRPGRAPGAAPGRGVDERGVGAAGAQVPARRRRRRVRAGVGAPRGCTWVTAPAAAAGRHRVRRRLPTRPGSRRTRRGQLVVRRDDRPAGEAAATRPARGSTAGRRRGAAGRRAARRRRRRRSGGAAGPGRRGTSRARSTGRAVRGIRARYWSCETGGYWILARASWSRWTGCRSAPRTAAGAAAGGAARTLSARHERG